MSKYFYILLVLVLSSNLCAQTFTQEWVYDNTLYYIGDIDGDGTIEFLDDDGTTLQIVDPNIQGVKYTFQDYGTIYYRNLPYELMQPFDFNNNGILDLVVNYKTIIDPSSNEVIFNCEEDGEEFSLFGPEDYDNDGILEILVKFETTSGVKSIFYSTGLTVTNIQENKSDIRQSFTLSQNYPNPFNPSTQIYYTIDTPGNVALNIFDSNGQLIKEFEKVHNSIGDYKIQWNGTNNNNEKVASGIYIYQVIMNNQMISKKMMLLK